MRRQRSTGCQDTVVATRANAIVRLLEVFPYCDAGYLAQCVAAHETAERDDDDIVTRVSRKIKELNHGEYPSVSMVGGSETLDGGPSSEGRLMKLDSRRRNSSSDQTRSTFQRDEVETLTRNKAL